jgi:glycosyltransferase involved in cell wall biosynthesis
MRILYHHRTLADGAEGIHIREIVEAFRSMGHEVRLTSVAQVSTSGPPSRLGQTLKARLPQALFELAGMMLSVIDYARFRWLLARNRPDAIYKRHANYDLGVLLAAQHAGIPTILEVNCAYSSPEYNRFEPLAFRRLALSVERTAVRRATVVLAVSTPLAGYLRMLRGTSSGVLVVPNGADPVKFSAATADPAEVRRRNGVDNAMVVGWTGIFRPWHGLDLLFSAVAELPDVVLLVIGDGPDEHALRSRAAKPDLNGRVIFSGRVPHGEIPQYIAAMDVAVVAADSTGHASPMKLLEYMAMERAVLAPRQPNIEDIVDDGVTGLLFTPGDAVELRQLLRRLQQDHALRLRLGQAARLKVVQERNWRNNATTALAALKGVPSRT